MFRWLPLVGRLTAFVVVLVSLTPSFAVADDCLCREPHHSSGHRGHHTYAREADHGLIHYPHVTYWGSGDREVRWGALDCPSYSTDKIAPSPWAYSTIAPYARHYHFSYGSSYGWGDCLDCRN